MNRDEFVNRVKALERKFGRETAQVIVKGVREELLNDHRYEEAANIKIFYHSIFGEELKEA